MAMNRLALALCSTAAGALLSYWCDPVSGRRRRAQAVDRLTHVARDSRHFAELATRDAKNRSVGLAAEARALLRPAHSDDATLAARVRSRLGRVVSHPHALDVTVQDGRVTVAGPVLQHEADAALACTRRVRGVVDVNDRMTRYERPDHVPALQGGIARPGPSRWEFAQQTWSPAARVVAGAIGTVLLAGGFGRRGPLGALLGLAGAALLTRSTANVRLAELTRGNGRSVRVQKSIRIDAPVERVFAFWCDVRNFPRFMRHVRQVDGELSGATHWRVDGIGGPPLEWTAQCIGLIDDELIAWSTLPGSAIRHAGVVRFERCADGATRVEVQMDYQPPAGVLGDRVARLLGFDPKRQLDDDLMRVKSYLETGHAAHDAAARSRAPQPAPRAGA